ncbi:MAG: DNA methyltransferase [Acidimicrobiia bacterium]|nr:DNA methyltransferase [Acidimicrobiia bacterium]
MAERRRSTATTAFGTGSRESHDASAFYARFTPPILSDDTEINHLAPSQLAEQAVLGNATDMGAVLPDKSVALVVTSPPYFVGKEYEDEVLRAAKDSEPLAEVPASYREYLDMLHAVFAECTRVLEPGGRIAVNVANLGRKPYRSLSSDVIRVLEDLGLLLRGEIIWQKGKSTSGSCAWGSFKSPANPVLRDTTERVIVASKGRFDRALSQEERRKRGLPHVASTNNDEFVEATRDVWEIDAESARRVGHPAPFPVDLPLKLIDLYTYEGDLVLDPFMGSGSTLVAAKRANRVGVGFDLDPEYVDLARARLADTRTRPTYRALEADVIELPGIEVPEADHTLEHFQARAHREGKKAQDIARQVLEEAGFTVLREQPKLGKLGIQFNFEVTNDQAEGNQWFVDVSGAFTTVRPGLMRTDTLWKSLGRAHVLTSAEPTARVLIVTSNLPKPGSEGDKALRAVGPKSIFDVVEMFSRDDVVRLNRYAKIAGEVPEAGFWSEDEIDRWFT